MQIIEGEHEENMGRYRWVVRREISRYRAASFRTHGTVLIRRGGRPSR